MTHERNSEGFPAADLRHSLVDHCRDRLPLQAEELLNSFENTGNAPVRSTLGETVVNIMNLYMGVGLLSIGFAIKLGGWISLVFLVSVSILFAASAKLLTRAVDRLPPSVVPSYPNLGAAAYRSLGHGMVIVMALSEFFGSVCICLIVFWHSVELLLPSKAVCIPLPTLALPLCLGARQVILVASLFLVLPAVWIRTFSKLTSIASSGMASSVILTLTVLLAFAMDPSQSKVDGAAKKVHKAVDAQHLPFAIGIFLMSFSGHAGLPSLRRSMAEPHRFESCVNLSFSLLLCIYSIMGIATYAYFGDGARVIVTENLTRSSSVKGLVLVSVWGLEIRMDKLLNVLVSVSAFAKIPSITFVVSELLLDIYKSSMPGSTGQPPSHHHEYAEEVVARTAVIAAACTVSSLYYNFLGHVESLVGGICSVTVSLLLPAVFYRKLFKEEIKSSWSHAGLIVMIVAAASATTLVAYSSIHDLHSR